MILDWRLPSKKPVSGDIIIAEELDGYYHIYEINSRFVEWDDSIIRWASLSKYMVKNKEDAQS